MVVDIYTFVDFFSNFGANVLWEKNTLKTRKRLHRTIILANRGPAQDFYHIKVIKCVKKLCPAKFLCNLERLEPTYIHLKNAKKRDFRKNSHSDLLLTVLCCTEAVGKNRGCELECSYHLLPKLREKTLKMLVA